MDPNANIQRQRELANMIEAADDNVDPAELASWADQLADLVLALDEWRLKGGFDPYHDDTGEVFTAMRSIVDYGMSAEEADYEQWLQDEGIERGSAEDVHVVHALRTVDRFLTEQAGR